MCVLILVINNLWDNRLSFHFMFDNLAILGRLILIARRGAHLERIRWDPKDGELCLARTKSGETLMEVRSDSDVQIDRQSWV